MQTERNIVGQWIAKRTEEIARLFPPATNVVDSAELMRQRGLPP